jgi:glucokinase
MLKRRFGIPVFINNDGDLFAYGESIGGFLPWVNGLLEKAGSQKRYKNLLGVTLGTGLGGGIVHDGKLFLGDNSVAGEMWLLRHKFSPRMNAEEGASLRAIQRVYAEDAGIPLKDSPPPKKIASIARGKNPGCQEAAVEAFRRLGEVLGDALANALTLTDSLAVIGGGISKADQLFLPAVVEELNASFAAPSGRQFRRLSAFAFNLEDAEQRKKFLAGDVREITVPGTTQKIKYDSLRRVGVGLSRLGTSEAVAIGAHVFALRKLDAK